MRGGLMRLIWGTRWGGNARDDGEVLEASQRQIEKSLPGASLTLHLHDTFGRAGECVLAALGMGVRSFDSSAGGLGGCPYASTPERRAPGEHLNAAAGGGDDAEKQAGVSGLGG